MKIVLYAAVLLATSFITARAEEETPNLVANGSMEEVEEGKESPSKWSVHSGKALLTTVQAENGKALSIQLEGARNPSWIRSATIAVRPNTTYRLSVDFKGDGSASLLPWMGVKVYESAGGWNPEGGHYLIQDRASRPWKTKESTFTTRDNTKWIYIGILVQDPEGGTLLLDNMTLQKME